MTRLCSCMLPVLFTFFSGVAFAGFDITRDVLRPVQHLGKRSLVETGNALGKVMRPGAEASGKVLGPTTQAIGTVVQPAGEAFVNGVNGLSKEIEKHKTEIIVIAIVATVGYAACVDGCTVLLALGDASFKIGSFGGAAVGAGVGAAATSLGSSEQSKPSSPQGHSSDEESHNTDLPYPASPEPSADSKPLPQLYDQLPKTDPSTLPWKMGGFLTLGVPSTESNPDKDVAGDITKDVAKDILSGDMSPAKIIFDITTKPTELSANQNWDEDRECNARLSNLLHIMIKENTLEVKLVPNITNKDLQPPSPELKPASTEFRVEPITVKQEIEVKSELVGLLTGLGPAEVKRRVQNGVKEDLSDANLKVVRKNLEDLKTVKPIGQ